MTKNLNLLQKTNVNELSSCLTAVINEAVEEATSRAQFMNCFLRLTFEVFSEASRHKFASAEVCFAITVAS